MIWSTQADRARIARIEARREQYRVLAGDATSPDERLRHEQMLRRLDRQARMARTYPVGILLLWSCLLVPLLAWAIARRHGHPTAGLVAGLAIAAAEATALLRRRRR